MSVKFKSFTESTQADWAAMNAYNREHEAHRSVAILEHLKLLDTPCGFPVTRLQHSLQPAELAAEAGEDEEYVVCALLHDIGDTLGTVNHPDVAAAILEPFVSEENHWMVKHHGIFQGLNFFHHIGLDPNMRDQYRDNPHFERTAHFIAEYDNVAFDYEKPDLSLELFEPMVKRVFSNVRRSIYTPT
ncbi:MAG: HD domain-containing protein [Gammaproteobacteria bacterium]|nr:HD domain-containing protein [Gammaproteobacteria bacterium]